MWAQCDVCDDIKRRNTGGESRMRLPYLDPRVTEKHVRVTESGETELFWRCENCGYTSTDPDLRKGCPFCHRGVGWLP